MSSSWPFVLLGEILEERRDVPNIEDVSNGKIPLVSKIRFSDGTIELRKDGASKTGLILVKPGDLLVSGINATKGAIAIYGLENKVPAAATIHYSSYIVKDDLLDVHFLWWYLRSNAFRKILKKAIPGSIKSELKASRLLGIKIPLPLIDEQRRIASKVEYFTRRIGEVRSINENKKKKIEMLIQSCPSFYMSKYDQCDKISRILLEPPRNGWSARCQNDSDGVSVLALSAVTGFQYDPKAFKRTSEPTYPGANYWLKPGDLLITRSNTQEFVGHAAIYTGEPSPCIYPDLMMRINVDKSLADPKFVWLWLQTELVRKYISSNARGTNPTMKKISQKIVMNIPFPLGVDISEQKMVANQIETLQKVALKAEISQNEIQTKLGNFMPSIIDKIFEDAS